MNLKRTREEWQEPVHIPDTVLQSHGEHYVYIAKTAREFAVSLGEAQHDIAALHAEIQRMRNIVQQLVNLHYGDYDEGTDVDGVIFAAKRMVAGHDQP